VQKRAASTLQSDPFAECSKIKSCCIKAELESVGEFAAPDYCVRDSAKKYLPMIALFRRKSI